jgi:hypothetical protein
VAIFALTVPLAGCATLGSVAQPDVSATAAGDSWTVVVTGSPTPSGTAAGRPRAASASPAISLGTPDPQCGQTRGPGQVVIPLTVVPGSRSLSVSWPRYGSSSSYRIGAVPQILVNGSQPAVRWKPVQGGAGCTVTGTITGLTSGAPYIVWLDAPGTGYLNDGTRHPYSGSSGVVYPK